MDEPEPRKGRAVLSEDEDGAIASRMSFHLALCSRNTLFRPNESSISENERYDQEFIDQQWECLSARPYSIENASAAVSKHSTRRVRFATEALMDLFYHSNSQSAPEMELTSLGPPGPPINTDLCQRITQASPHNATECYGIVGHSLRTFTLQPRENVNIDHSHTIQEALRKAQVLSPRITSWPLWFRLRTAHDISTAFVHFFDTAWLPQLPDLQDFFLLVHSDPSGFNSPDLTNMSQTSVARRLADDRSVGQREDAAGIARLAILSCGYLLAQVIQGKCVEGLRVRPDMNEDDIWATWDKGRWAVRAIEEDVDVEGLTGCAAAVRWCFYRSRNALPSKGNDQWLRFHGEVVMRLEDALRSYEDVPRIVEKSRRGVQCQYGESSASGEV